MNFGQGTIQLILLFFLQNFTALKRLSLAYITTTDQPDFTRISDFTREEPFTRPQLKVLNLSNNILDTLDMLNICMICPHITTLLLAHCCITDGGLRAIAHQNPLPEDFSWFPVKVWPFSGPCFPPDSTGNNSLEILDVSFGNWQSRVLKEVLPWLPNLKELYAVGCDLITEVPNQKVCIIQHNLWSHEMSDDVIQQFRSVHRTKTKHE